MRKKEERVKALKGLFVPDFWEDFKEVIGNCELMTAALKTTDPDCLTDIEFAFKPGEKMIVYREFIQAYKKGWIGVRRCVVITYLAEHTNLADNSDLPTRINTIRQGFKRHRLVFCE